MAPPKVSYLQVYTKINPMSTGLRYLQLTSHVRVDEASVLQHLSFHLTSKGDQYLQARSMEYHLPE